jgi:hypothetical protein
VIINAITNPNPVFSHSDTRNNIFTEKEKLFLSSLESKCVFPVRSLSRERFRYMIRVFAELPAALVETLMGVLSLSSRIAG